MKRIRIGNYVAGIRFNRTGHAIFGNFMIGKVADTLGVLNSIRGTTTQMLFADFDCANIERIKDEIYREIPEALLFKSEMTGQDTHYFVISPCRYYPKEIRNTLVNLNHVDKKFVATYIRDGVNAIRFVPKVIGNKTSRHISLIEYIDNGKSDDTLYVRGMLRLLYQYYPNIENLMPAPTVDQTDDTTEEDLTLREYETIRW